jgi:TRAP-type C4-dicarboxylate transport system substrate-binding protein
LKKGHLWARLRSRKYRKPYALLSDKQKKLIREAYKKWAKENWGKRVEYAREYRKRNPAFGLRTAISSARRSGDIRELASVCEHAIAKLNEDSSKRRSKSKHS